jgi:hypothetical protein
MKIIKLIAENVKRLHAVSMQIWLECVGGNKDSVAIMMEDGEVV